MSLPQLDTRILFVTGKGGVGKTSIACATAIRLADEGHRVLLVSTDPASNLDEVLGVPLGATPRDVPGVAGLAALNVDPQEAARAYRERVVGPYRGVLPAAAVASMEEQLSGACTVEIAAFDQFTSLLGDPDATDAFGHVIFDTAPTGHTLRLLELPAAWSSFIDTNVGGTSCLGPLAGLTAQRALYAASRDALQDPARTTLLLVARPDRASLAEAERTRAELASLGIRNQHLVVNGVFTATDRSDPVARDLERRARTAMKALPPGLATLPRTELPLLPFGLVGLDALRAMGARAPSPDVPPVDDTPPEIGPTRTLDALVDDLARRGRGVVFTMGKGGVGKTRTAARIAEGLAARGHRVHLTTTDPAAHVAAAVQRRVGGLEVTRIDPAAETAAYSAEVMATAGRDLDEQGRALLAEDLRSPCTEEIAVFRAFARTVAGGEDRFVVIDTAPTGHTLLLLDAAEAYHREVLKRASGSPDAVQRLLPRLRDPRYTTVLLVTLPEATPVHEAAQLAGDLARAGIRPAAWVVNQSLTPLAVRDPVLVRRRAAEASYIREVQACASDCVLIPWEADMTSDETITIADATAADRNDVLALLRSSKLMVEGVPDDLQGFVVARAGETLLGVAGIEAHGESALLRSVAVVPEQRGSGIGKRLVDAALERAMAAGARDVVLLTEDADGWFERFGFERIQRDAAPEDVRRSAQFTGACPDSATVMRRRSPLRVLVLCTGNSARSQVAEALLSTLGEQRIQASSAGSRPAERVNPGAVEVLARHGIPWAGREPQSIDAVADQRWDVVITVCDNAKEACPVLPGQPVMVHWGLPDPAHIPDEAERRAAFEATYAALERRIRAMLELPLESMTDAERQRALRAFATV
ncbi:MAG TPA: arsenical pump-driving ATPase [Gemmatimonadales bacterium]|nr:arsenical pump-driving ATPase [Gemmatimonadales bacterium]